jgi:hypothetical protein
VPQCWPSPNNGKAEEGHDAKVNEPFIPVANQAGPIYDWAFGEFKHKNDLLENFSGSFEYLLAEEGTTIFSQGEIGHEAYLVSEGRVHLSQWDPDIKKSMVIESLDAGAMFGELPLIEEYAHLASVTKVEASSFLLGLQLDQRLSVTKTSLIFHGKALI